MIVCFYLRRACKACSYERLSRVQTTQGSTHREQVAGEPSSFMTCTILVIPASVLPSRLRPLQDGPGMCSHGSESTNQYWLDVYIAYSDSDIQALRAMQGPGQSNPTPKPNRQQREATTSTEDQEKPDVILHTIRARARPSATTHQHQFKDPAADTSHPSVLRKPQKGHDCSTRRCQCMVHSWRFLVSRCRRVTRVAPRVVPVHGLTWSQHGRGHRIA